MAYIPWLTLMRKYYVFIGLFENRVRPNCHPRVGRTTVSGVNEFVQKAELHMGVGPWSVAKSSWLERAELCHGLPELHAPLHLRLERVGDLPDHVRQEHDGDKVRQDGVGGRLGEGGFGGGSLGSLCRASKQSAGKDLAHLSLQADDGQDCAREVDLEVVKKTLHHLKAIQHFLASLLDLPFRMGASPRVSVAFGTGELHVYI
mmetsp:Transcript_3456/g.9947  ORF Transcript_3456/g.9947 Transcript_3456/m.9947 type:complete len:203 (+) Transcript_3456:1086-1694(+)